MDTATVPVLKTTNPSGGILLERQFPEMARRILQTLAQHAEILKRDYPPRSSRVSVR